MRKTLTTTLLALALAGIALTAAPAASAATCNTISPALGYAVETCNYVLSGEAARDVGDTVTFLGNEADEVVGFVVDTYGEHLP